MVAQCGRISVAATVGVVPVELSAVKVAALGTVAGEEAGVENSDTSSGGEAQGACASVCVAGITKDVSGLAVLSTWVGPGTEAIGARATAVSCFLAGLKVSAADCVLAGAAVWVDAVALIADGIEASLAAKAEIG